MNATTNARFKKVGPGYYELRRQIQLTHKDGRVEQVEALFEAHLRSDEIPGWNLAITVIRNGERSTELSNYSEIYGTKWEIAQSVGSGILDKWTFHASLNAWCI